MKCKYRFRVDGRLRVGFCVPLQCSGRTFSVETDQYDLVTHIAVEVSLTRREDWPFFRENPESGVRAELVPRSPHLPLIQKELRTLQGFLALFGLDRIDLENPELEWIPASEEERMELHMSSFKTSTTPLPSDQLTPVPFELIARSILASDSADAIEIPLNFFRRGVLDMAEKSYIEAIYDFYFVIETLFADGKFREREVLRAFRASEDLRSAISQVLSSHHSTITHDKRIYKKFLEAYGDTSVDEVLLRLFRLRGRLHHHTQNRRTGWHPDMQLNFEIDAYFLQAVTQKLVTWLASPYLFAGKVEGDLKELVARRKRRSEKAE